MAGLDPAIHVLFKENGKTWMPATSAGMTENMTMSSVESLPYRPCAGMMVLNRDGLVFIGRRSNGPEHIDRVHDWQMPQGGVDEGEDTYKAALRELYEETNIRSVEKLGEIPDWLYYDIPRDLIGQAWGGKYRGQKQKWYALRFTGEDREIDIAHPAGGHEPEFVEWRWERMSALPNIVVPFKRATYERVVKEFAKFARP
jgi:putative (di)nucleoside polyphosphate hydrolase